MNTILLFLTILSISFLDANSSGEVIAQIGDKVITVQDFIERAEYTPRPLYCKGNSTIDKRIILNTLIGEKLFSMEMKKDIPNAIDKYLIGRKNQKMREVLFNHVTSEVLIQKDKFSHWYNLASLEYDISYLSVLDIELVEEISNSMIAGESLNDIYFSYTNSLDIPTREKINLFTIGNRALREELFSKAWSKGDVLGPIVTDDNIIMFVQVDKRKKVFNLKPNAIMQMNDEISTLISSHLREGKHEKFVSNLMSDMTFDLNPKVYLKFSESIRKWYNEMDDISSASDSGNKNSQLKIESTEDILLSLNGEKISVDQVISWLAIHPLVFRDGYYKDLNFSDQLRYALADLIRDRTLNDKSKEFNLDKHPKVIAEYNKWYDNYRAIAQRKEIVGEKFLNSTKVGSALNEYFTSLTQKYTEQIKINVELLDNISLSSIDMVTYNKIGPYKLTVPFFPVITDTYKFNYGQPISMDIYE